MWEKEKYYFCNPKTARGDEMGGEPRGDEVH